MKTSGVYGKFEGAMDLHTVRSFSLRFAAFSRTFRGFLVSPVAQVPKQKTGITHRPSVVSKLRKVVSELPNAQAARMTMLNYAVTFL